MIERLPVAFAIFYLLGSIAAGVWDAPRPEQFESLGEFASALDGSLWRRTLILFPLGVTASIVTILAMLGHANLRSARGRLQILALLSLLVGGFLWILFGEPTAHAVVRAAQAGREAELPPLLARWETFGEISTVLALVMAASLLVASRMPLVHAERGPFSSLTPRHRTLLLLLGAATLFEGYDRFIVSLALPYIGDDLGANESVLGLALSAIRIGALLSIVLGRMADRHGRRRILLLTILAYTIATAATGFSRTIVEFVIFQLAATIFLVTELSLAQVVITEEFPKSFRAQGQGFLGAFGALGAGMAAVLFPIFQETVLGWRGLYFLGILPLLLIAWLRRAMPETRRWQDAHSRGETRDLRVRELLAPGLRLRFATLVTLAVTMTASLGPAFAFASYRATKEFGWAPSQVSGMILLGGGLGLAGWFVFGALAERIGRRSVGMIGAAGAGVAVAAFYQTSWLLAAFALLVFMEAGAQIALNALGTELFPTRLRSTAKAWLTNAWIIGSMLGLGIVGALSSPLGGSNVVVTLLAFLPVVASPILFLLPEPRGLELEALEPAATEIRRARAAR